MVASASAEMIREGFHPDFPDGTETQIAEIRASLDSVTATDAQDLRGLLWSSIDNDTSRDLDQIEVAERVDGGIRVRVAIADVSAAVLKETVIDRLYRERFHVGS
jgi:exoribonuclease-2